MSCLQGNYECRPIIGINNIKVNTSFNKRSYAIKFIGSNGAEDAILTDIRVIVNRD